MGADCNWVSLASKWLPCLRSGTGLFQLWFVLLVAVIAWFLSQNSHNRTHFHSSVTFHSHKVYWMDDLNSGRADSARRYSLYKWKAAFAVWRNSLLHWYYIIRPEPRRNWQQAFNRRLTSNARHKHARCYCYSCGRCDELNSFEKSCLSISHNFT